MTEFWVNDERIVTDVPDGTLLLDFLRKNLHRTGTKEGCKEGDCGACSVMIGELVDGRVRYKVVTSCLVPVGEAHGKHVVTVEGVAKGDALNPVQSAMVERGGSQCGYCTPGFIVSMTWWMLAERKPPSMDGIKRAVSGNLCRCTGYNSIKRSGEDLIALFGPGGELDGVWRDEERIRRLAERGLIPRYFLDVPERLAEIAPRTYPSGEADFYIGGGTDLYVQRGEVIPDSSVDLLSRYPEMRGIRVEDDALVLGALTTFEEFGAHEKVREWIPDIDNWMWLIASLHLRNRATLAGNIVNASPIGDMSNLLLALDAELVLAKGDDRRTVPLKSFYLGYKKYDKLPHELVLEIRIPTPKNGAKIRFEKVSKRKALDIATVNSAAKIAIDADGIVRESVSQRGGVAAFPFWLKNTGEFLEGKHISPSTARQAVELAVSEISPISDVRGSADYKRTLTRNFVIAHLMSVSDVKLEDFR
ncbi:MAG: FAD binding domain-containing protein [bacterium]